MPTKSNQQNQIDERESDHNARIQKMIKRKGELLKMKKSERRGGLQSVEDIIARLKRWNVELVYEKAQKR